VKSFRKLNIFLQILIYGNDHRLTDALLRIAEYIEHDKWKPEDGIIVT